MNVYILMLNQFIFVLLLEISKKSTRKLKTVENTKNV